MGCIASKYLKQMLFFAMRKHSSFGSIAKMGTTIAKTKKMVGEFILKYGKMQTKSSLEQH
jgi:hypothetical protein